MGWFSDDHEYSHVKSRHAAGAGTMLNRNRGAKQAFEVTALATGFGLQGASLATGASAIALMSGATVATGGIALIAASGAIAAGTVVASGISAKKTHSHIQNLSEINRKGSMAYPCSELSEFDGGVTGDARKRPLHQQLYQVTLEYIFNQKLEKMGKKTAGAMGMALLTGTYAVGRKIYKNVKGTQGTRRCMAAEALSVHLLTHQCALADAIATELLSLSPAELEWLKRQDNDTVGPLLAKKMKSK